MDAGEIIALAAILVGILLSTVVFIWQTHSQNTRLEAQNSRLEAKVDALYDRMGEYEQRNARLDGINETLSQILRQQSHTHESAD